MFYRFAELPVTVAAVLAALIYIARKLNQLLRKADEILGLPSAYRKLELTVIENTEAIAELTVQVAHLTAVERARGGM